MDTALTEAPLGTVPQSRHFPRRNRLIAGLSLGCVIVEASLRSGTLITADLAHRYGRDLFAVPGSPLDPRARGCNALLRGNGAYLTETAADVLAHLQDYPKDGAPFATGFAEPAAGWGDGRDDAVAACPAVRALLSPTPVTVDEVVARCQFSVSQVLAALAELELGGAAMFLPGGMVTSRPEPFD